MEGNQTSTQNRSSNFVLKKSHNTANEPEEAANSMRRNKGKEKVNQEEIAHNLGGTCVRLPRRKNVGHGVFINENSGETIYNVSHFLVILEGFSYY